MADVLQHAIERLDQIIEHVADSSSLAALARLARAQAKQIAWMKRYIETGGTEGSELASAMEYEAAIRAFAEGK